MDLFDIDQEICRNFKFKGDLQMSKNGDFCQNH